MTHSKKASARFPLNAFNRKQKWERRHQEEAIQHQLVDYRARLARATGMTDKLQLLGRFKDYMPVLRGFEAAWRIVEQNNGWGVETVEACAQNADVRVALGHMGLMPPTMENLVLLFKSQEFEAYRSDSEYLRCLAAEKRAHEHLPRLIADAIAREHRYSEGNRRSAALYDAVREANQQILNGGRKVDEDDLEAFLTQEFAGDANDEDDDHDEDDDG